jgi:hypothetical protein
MRDKILLKSCVNPLALFSLEPLIAEINVQPNSETVLSDLCSRNSDCSLEAMIERCTEISLLNYTLAIVPAEKNILTKLIWPLRDARVSYIMGNYLGTIALSGMMAEMAAIVFFDLGDEKTKNIPLDKKQQVILFGCRFECLGQKQRIMELKKLGIISQELGGAFETIRKIRNNYLHFWSYDHGAAPRDAVKVFRSAIEIAVALLGVGFEDGKTILTPEMVRYLKKRKLYKSVTPNSV